ncbi:MAG: small-conductance mechanosensitive channel [Arenicella sp.]|jgi:small-conductance mechanosensitive channel
MTTINDLKTFWNFKLIDTVGGTVISVADVILVLGLVYAGYLLSRLIEHILARRLAKTELRPDLVIVIKRISFYSIFLMVGLTILGLLGIPITAFAFATGAIAIGIGFGAQNIINNFISGWILIAERPIRVNDIIEIDGFFGVVKNVGTRSTLVHRTDGVHVLVPNSKFLENTVINWTLVDGFIRTQVRVGAAYGSDPAKVLAIIQECVIKREEVLSEPKPEFIFEDFGDSALVFDAYFWCDVGCGKTLRSIRSDVRLAISKAFAEAGIVIAFPQRDIHLFTESPIEVQVSSKDAKLGT